MKFLKVLAVAALLVPTVASAQTTQLTVAQLHAQLSQLTPEQMRTLERDIGKSLGGMTWDQLSAFYSTLSKEDHAQIKQALRQETIRSSQIRATNFTFGWGGALFGLLLLNRTNSALPLPTAPTSTTRTN